MIGRATTPKDEMPFTVLCKGGDGLGYRESTSWWWCAHGGNSGTPGLRDEQNPAVENGDTCAMREQHVGLLEAGTENKAAPSPTEPTGANDIVRTVGDMNSVMHEDVMRVSIVSKHGNFGSPDNRRCKHGALDAANAKRARSSRALKEERYIADTTTLRPPVHDIYVIGLARIELVAEEKRLDTLIGDEVKDNGVIDRQRGGVNGIDGAHECTVAEVRADGVGDASMVTGKDTTNDVRPHREQKEIACWS